jgi:hypothetical protein
MYLTDCDLTDRLNAHLEQCPRYGPFADMVSATMLLKKLQVRLKCCVPQCLLFAAVLNKKANHGMAIPVHCVSFSCAWIMLCVQRALVGHAIQCQPSTPANAWPQHRNTPRQAAELSALLHSFAQNGALSACSDKLL